MKRLLAVLCVVALVAAAFATIPALAATKRVTVRDNVFRPTSLTVRRGTIVRWVWRGRNPHNVRTRPGSPLRFASTIKRRGSYSKRLTRRGTYRIICTIHAPRMRMTIRVR